MPRKPKPTAQQVYEFSKDVKKYVDQGLSVSDICRLSGYSKNLSRRMVTEIKNNTEFLSPEDRLNKIIDFRENHGLSFKEIGKIVGLTEHSAGKLYRAAGKDAEYFLPKKKFEEIDRLFLEDLKREKEAFLLLCQLSQPDDARQ